MAVAGALVALGAVGLLTLSWMFTFLTGTPERITVSQCGTYQNIFMEVAPGTPGTWCRTAELDDVVEAFGVTHSDRSQSVTAVVKRGPLSRDDKIYAPAWDDFVELALSAGVVLGGLSWLGAGAALAQKRHRRTTVVVPHSEIFSGHARPSISLAARTPPEGVSGN